MKKIFNLFLLMLSMFLITSCDNFQSKDNTDEEKPTVYEITTEVTDVVDKVSGSSIGVYNVNKSTGSAVIFYDDEKYVYALTNYHVIAENTKIQVYLNDSVYKNAEVIAYDQNIDIACIKYEIPFGQDYTVSKIYKDEIVNPGSTCIAIGSPLGFEYFNSVAVGYVGKVFSDLIQHSAPINPGNSGGALFNLSGRLIGINVSKIVASTTEVPVSGMCFSINMNEVINFLDINSIKWC